MMSRPIAECSLCRDGQGFGHVTNRGWVARGPGSPFHFSQDNEGGRSSERFFGKSSCLSNWPKRTPPSDLISGCNQQGTNEPRVFHTRCKLGSALL